MAIRPVNTLKSRGAVTCFGVGDGWPSADQGHSSFLYQLDGAAFLIDCGEPISRTFKASGLSYDLVDRLFLSHLHFDHAGGFFMLMQGFILERRTKPLTVHAPADAIAPLRALLRAACLFDELLPFPLEFQSLSAGGPVAVGPMAVTPHPTSHLAGLREKFQARYPLAFEAFSFLMEADGVRLGHSADIGAKEDLEPLLAKPLDLLVCELAHVPPAELFPYLRGRPIKKIAFVHLARTYRQQLAEVQAEAKAALDPIKVFFPEDGDELALEPAGLPGR